jgi:hypothetical protein
MDLNRKEGWERNTTIKIEEQHLLGQSANV